MVDNELLVNDVYKDDCYTKLYLNNQSESLFKFNYKNNNFFLENISIKRPIDRVSDQVINEGYYDLETPYGYGGFVTNTEDTKFLEEALESYHEKCFSENIIAEFVRFNPFIFIPQKIQEFFDFYVEDRETVFIDLRKSYDTIYAEYRSSLRRNIKKAIKNQVTFNELPKDERYINNFIQLYYQTMKQNNAGSFYFFSEKYFKELFECPFVKLFGAFLDDKIINIIIILESEPIIYYHLGATDPEYYYLNTNAFIFDELVKYYQSKNYGYFYLGGGNSPDPEDPLFKYKSKFSSETLNFTIAGKVFNHEKYNDYLKSWKERNPEWDIKYFLKYRL